MAKTVLVMPRRVYEYDGPPRVCHKGHVYYDSDIMRENYAIPPLSDRDITTSQVDEPLDIIVSGGSMGGLFTALAFTQIGHNVTVYEQTERGKMKERGAGIIAHPEMLHYLETQEIADWDEISTHTARTHHVDRDGSIADVEGVVTYTTSWDTVYRNLRAELPAESYQMDSKVVDVEQSNDGVVVRFADGGEASGDLLVAAEGYRSNIRQQHLLDRDPEYTNYVAWRGVIPESELPTEYEVRFGEIYNIFHAPESQILSYPVPGPNGEVTKGDRRINWVWYCRYDDREELDDLLYDREGNQRSHSLPPGNMREKIRQKQVHLAEEQLPDFFSWLVAATEQPFIQNIYDLTVPQMVFNRVCLIGDAAFFIRPHMAAGTAHAAADAFELAESVYHHDNLDRALKEWETDQLAMGYRLVEEARRRGDRYTGQF
jgi:2,6-dihydroxypyridine 3-monooxygenase